MITANYIEEIYNTVKRVFDCGLPYQIVGVYAIVSTSDDGNYDAAVKGNTRKICIQEYTKKNLTKLYIELYNELEEEYGDRILKVEFVGGNSGTILSVVNNIGHSNSIKKRQLNTWYKCTDEDYWSPLDDIETIVKLELDGTKFVYLKDTCPYGWNALVKSDAEFMNVKK